MVNVIHGDCLEVMPTLEAGSVDTIITDPPYPKEFNHLFGAMAKEAKRVLRVGGSLVTLCGHSQLPYILPDMMQHLRYRWIAKLDQPGKSARMAMGVRVTWKPILWFVNEKLSPQRNIVDMCISDKRSKSNGHPWEQSTGFSDWAVQSMTSEGDTVLDPFMGTGTTAISCLNYGRDFIGIEQDADYIEIARRRIEHWQGRNRQFELL